MDIALLTSAGNCRMVMRYVLTSALVVWIADLLETFPDEVELVWFVPNSMAKLLFFANRYIPIDVITGLIYLYGDDMSKCKMLYDVSTGFYIVGIALSEAVMFYRLYALSGQSRKYKIWLTLLYGVVHVGGTAPFVKYWIESMRYATTPIPRLMSCRQIKGTIYFAVGWWSTVMTAEAIVLALTLRIAWRDHRTSRSPLMTIFYRDGIFYFIALAISSVVNIILVASLETQCQVIGAIFSRVLHSMLAYRTILHLRRQSRLQSRGVDMGGAFKSGRLPMSDNSNPSNIKFASRPVQASQDTTSTFASSA